MTPESVAPTTGRALAEVVEKAPAAGAAVEARGLTVRYGRRAALDGVSFAVPPGTVCAVLGKNGAGKSSLVRCLLGQQRPSGGSARLFGADPWRRRARLMERVGVVPEVPDCPPALAPRDLVALCARLYRRWDGAAVRERLRRFAVPLEVPFGRLSRGQKTQVELALGLGHGPELLVLDDPTLGLDALARKALLDELIGELADRGTTVLLTTHDLAGVERIADRVAVLREGRLVLDEEVESLKGRFRRLSVPRQLAGDGAAMTAARLDALRPVSLVSRAWASEAVVSAFAPERLEGLPGAAGGEGFEVATLTLEEIFVALHETSPEVRP